MINYPRNSVVAVGDNYFVCLTTFKPAPNSFLSIILYLQVVSRRYGCYVLWIDGSPGFGIHIDFHIDFHID